MIVAVVPAYDVEGIAVLARERYENGGACNRSLLVVDGVLMMVVVQRELVPWRRHHRDMVVAYEVEAIVVFARKEI